MDDWMVSGKRVSNAWVICPRAGDNIPKGLLIPHKPTSAIVDEGKAGDPCESEDLALGDGPASHQLVGRVTAYQGDDG